MYSLKIQTPNYTVEVQEMKARPEVRPFCVDCLLVQYKLDDGTHVERYVPAATSEIKITRKPVA